MPDTVPLEPSSAQMRAMADAASEFIVGFIDRLGDASASDDVGVGALTQPLRARAPEAGRPFEELLGVFAEGTMKGHNTAGPGWLAYVPGGGLFSAAVADFLACGVNRFVGVWEPAPVLAQMEATAVRWLCDLFGYPGDSRGILTSGGSMSHFSAIVTARHALLGDDFGKGTAYVTDQTHSAALKAAVLAGIPRDHVRVVPTTPGFEMDPQLLSEAIKRDRAGGMQPFYVVASAGTTNTGAIDPLHEIASVTTELGLWLHVDGAYGGFFQLTERGRRLFSGIDRADSITLDPHKSMFLPYGTGALLVRDGRQLRAAHEVHAESFLQDLAGEDDIPNFADYSPELSRDFRGLRVWLPIQLHGLGAFRAALDEKLDLALFLHESLGKISGLELPVAPRLSTVVFRVAPSVDGAEAKTRELLRRINATRRVFLSSTELDDRFTIRVCILSHRTHRDRIEELIEIVTHAATEILET
jgi:aromatic-L-amino-acid decarboxylase